jgi:predicted TIM-barrel fold metal-dependent hydrolase
LIEVPNSSGTTQPRLAAPEGACDCHIHIYDPRFPMARELRGTPDATAADYKLLQRRIGTSRTVVVQPAAYGTDNRVTVAAIEQLGRDDARGIAVLHPEASDAELEALNAAGIRGLRFTLHDPRTAVTTPAMIEPLARRIQAFGWHTQLHLRAEQIVEMAPLIERLPGTVVIDHMGRMAQPQGVHHPAFALVRRWLDEGRTWVKLSGPYLETRTGSPAYADVTRVAREYAKLAAERLVWGSDWPHPTEATAKPDDAVLFDLLGEWAPAEGLRRRILVENPETLYGFANSYPKMGLSYPQP